ncbi:MAG: MBL fold metallo-hydrolase [Paracoccaceae bacterium]|nr:MBL fold metallo-hydrolase [Paracoccaceae bacterium]MDE2912178.1 MBL fold metallo-hydrolase [Paracoccaceae bacterium]
MAEFTWYGQASFGIVSKEGLRIVTDPYDPDKAGFKPFPDPADIVIKSSSNDDFHDNDHLVPKKPDATVIDALVVALNGGRTSSHGIDVSAIEAMEHDDHPSGHPDQNAMYRFAVDGLDIGHMGDMGNDFSDAQLSFFDGVDVLLSHAGGFPVISLKELMRIVGHVRPGLVIPMHYRTPEYLLDNMHTIDEFLKRFPSDLVDFADGCTVSLDRGSLPDSTRALVFEPY